ncbi:MAG: hypothetical protein EOO23_03140 [Comamonadaceae bacterium]|nr:MAG: hypothetical protein EOO23_03140 [Comamonadaceae bacterium]
MNGKEYASGAFMGAGIHKVAFLCIAAIWAVLWIPLTILFVTVYVPLNSLPCMLRRGDWQHAILAALAASWPVWLTALAMD